MWLVTLNNEGDFEALVAKLPAELGLSGYRVEKSATGILHALAPPDTSLPHYALIPEVDASANAFLDGAVRTLRVDALISSGVALPCGHAWNAADPLVPPLCYRSVGPFELGSNPVLYEELKFDRDIQTSLAGLFLPGRTLAGLALFSCRKPLNSAELRDWLETHLSCQGSDMQTADLILSARHRGLRSGCVKALANPEARTTLLNVWRTYSVSLLAG